MILVYDLNYNLINTYELLTIKGVKGHHYGNWHWGPCFTISDEIYGMAYIQKSPLGGSNSNTNLILLDTFECQFTITSQYAQEYFPYGVSLIKNWIRDNKLNQIGI